MILIAGGGVPSDDGAPATVAVTVQTSAGANRPSDSLRGSADAGAEARSLIVDPPMQRTCVGSRVELNGPDFGPRELHYQWRQNGEEIPGATGRILIFPSIAEADSGSYSVIITGADFQTLIPAAAHVSVIPVPRIVAQPQSQSVCAGRPASFEVAADGESLHYQWYRNGGAIYGADGPSLKLATVTSSDSGVYSVEVFGGECEIEGAHSAVASLSVTPRISIERQPVGRSARFGEPVTLSVAASGQELSYQWRKDGLKIPGANAAVYSIPAATSMDRGVYDVVVTSGCGTVVASAGATVTLEGTASVTGGGARTLRSVAMDISPNPAVSRTTLRLTGLTAKLRAGARLAIFDARGTRLRDLTDRIGGDVVDIDVSTLPAGTYYCRLIASCGASLVRRLVVVR
jgi:hypothetical protein